MNKFRLLLLALMIFASGSIFASGWNDYEADIGSGFTIERMNSFQVCIGLTGGNLLLCPEEGGKFGPVENYAFTASHLLVKTLGVMPHPKNPTMPTGDPSKEFYFLVEKQTNKVTGPLSKEEFIANKLVPSNINWESPSNPNILLPLFGSLMFLAIYALLFGWPLILGAIIVLLVIYIRKKDS